MVRFSVPAAKSGSRTEAGQRPLPRRRRGTFAGEPRRKRLFRGIGRMRIVGWIQANVFSPDFVSSQRRAAATVELPAALPCGRRRSARTAEMVVNTSKSRVRPNRDSRGKAMTNAPWRTCFFKMVARVSTPSGKRIPSCPARRVWGRRPRGCCMGKASVTTLCAGAFRANPAGGERSMRGVKRVVAVRAEGIGPQGIDGNQKDVEARSRRMPPASCRFPQVGGQAGGQSGRQ